MWSSPTAAFYALCVLAPLERGDQHRKLGLEFMRRVRDSFRDAARRLGHPAAKWPLVREHIPGSLRSPDGKALPSAVSFLRFKKGRHPSWTRQKIRRRIRDRLGTAPSERTLRGGMDILVQANAVRVRHRNPHRPEYVFVRIPTGERLAGTPGLRKALHLDEADDKNATIARALQDTAKLAALQLRALRVKDWEGLVRDGMD